MNSIEPMILFNQETDLIYIRKVISYIRKVNMHVSLPPPSNYSSEA